MTDTDPTHATLTMVQLCKFISPVPGSKTCKYGFDPEKLPKDGSPLPIEPDCGFFDNAKECPTYVDGERITPEADRARREGR